jgi:hypothetical protein
MRQFLEQTQKKDKKKRRKILFFKEIFIFINVYGTQYMMRRNETKAKIKKITANFSSRDEKFRISYTNKLRNVI